MEKNLKDNTYISPEVKVVKLSLSSNLFAGSGDGNASLEPIEGGYW